MQSHHFYALPETSRLKGRLVVIEVNIVENIEMKLCSAFDRA
jgi:hypothetical protein